MSGGFLTANNDDCQDAAKMRKREEVGGPAEVGNDIVMTASINRNEDTGIRVIGWFGLAHDTAAVDDLVLVLQTFEPGADSQRLHNVYDSNEIIYQLKIFLCKLTPSFSRCAMCC